MLAVLVSVTVTMVTNASAHRTDGYSSDSTIGMTSTDWMSWLHPATQLSQLSLPGTHDTGAYIFGGDLAFTQSMSMERQLLSGIRAWDIRLAFDPNNHDQLMVYHGPAPQGHIFDRDVLATASDFLDDHPSEVIVMRIKHERGSKDGFPAKVKADLEKFDRVYRGSSNNPTLRDIRGKIVPLPWMLGPERMGIPWGLLDSQDEADLETRWDVADKFAAVKDQLAESASGPNGTTYANFLSASKGALPYFVASGHNSPQTDAPHELTGWITATCELDPKCIPEYLRVDCLGSSCSIAFEGVNVMTMNLLRNRVAPSRVGLVYADFPGKGLVQAVIDQNENFTGGALYQSAADRCVEVPGGSTQNSTQVRLGDCHFNDSQRWQATSHEELRVYGNKCLDARMSGTTDGTVVQLFDCNGTGAQKWALRPDGSLVNIQSGKCLDAYQQGTAHGTPLVLWTCNGGGNQKWERPQ